MLVTACGSSSRDDAWSGKAIGLSQRELHPAVVNSQLGLGRNRISFGLFDADGKMLNDASASVRLYTLDGDRGVSRGEHVLRPATLREDLQHKHGDGSTHQHQDPLITVYATDVELDKAEWWGAELTVRRGAKRYKPTRLRFFVGEHTAEPANGDAAPRSKQLVLRDVKDLAAIDSSDPPHPELHQITVAEALDARKPTVIVFATPAFCQTRFCGPMVEAVVYPLVRPYREKVSFIHIEPYELDQARAGKLVPVPQMQEWGLTTEPWIFVMDAGGKVAAKFEGVASQDEVRAVLDGLLRAQP